MMGIPKRPSWLKFHVRTLLEVVAVIALLLAWYSSTRPHAIRPGNLVRIECPNALFGLPISGVYVVDRDGHVNFGGYYPTVKIGGMNAEDARARVTDELSKTLDRPQVNLTIEAWGAELTSADELKQLNDENTRLKSEVKELRSEVDDLTALVKKARSQGDSE